MATTGPAGVAEGVAGSPGAGEGPAKRRQVKKTRKKLRKSLLPPCEKDFGRGCQRGCSSCCGVRPMDVLDYLRENVDAWDRRRASYNPNADPLDNELVSVKLPHEFVVVKNRKRGNQFRAQVLERIDDKRFKIYVKQSRYPNTIRQIFVVPRTALKRDKQRVPSATVQELARRVGEGGAPGRTQYRIDAYRDAIRQRFRKRRKAAAASD